MNIFILLFLEFFKTGLFAVGGGLATIPFLHEMINKYHWFDVKALIDMIAVSESTPGPMGVNMATYVGYITALKDYGIVGAILGALSTTLGLVIPSLIIICIIAQFLKKFKDNKIIKDIFYGLRPAVTALIASAAFSIFSVTLFNYSKYEANNNIYSLFNIPQIILFFILLVVSKFNKKLHPIVMIIACAIIGIIFKFQ